MHTDDTQTQYRQQTDFWREERLGRFTASEIFKLMTEPRNKADKEKGILSETAKSYVLEKIAELLTGFAKEFANDATVWGLENEHLARTWYEKLKGVKVEELPFVKYGEHAGGSPDGKVGEGLIEIKCPFDTTNHLRHCLIVTQEQFKANFPNYYWQMQANILFTNSDWCDFVSFDKRIQTDIALFVFRVEKDKNDCDLILKKISQAIELKEMWLETFGNYFLKIGADVL